MKNGVTYYTHGTAVIDVYFPNDDTTCHGCSWCAEQDSLKRWRCRLTNELIFFPMSSVGDKCPVVFEEGRAENV